MKAHSKFGHFFCNNNNAFQILYMECLELHQLEISYLSLKQIIIMWHKIEKLLI